MSQAPNITKLEQEVAHYLTTGESDSLGGAFPGNNIRERLICYDRYLRKALINEVRRRVRGRRQNQVPSDFDRPAWTRRKVAPMIAGMFPAAEREIVLEVAERSIVFLTHNTIYPILRDVSFLETAWTIANMYLGSLGAPTFDGRQIVGLSEETTCYVSLEYFTDKDPFADYVVHEVAHIFHNSKRETHNLPYARRKEWMLDIAFANRETFAYSCEVYSRILEQARKPTERAALLEQYADGPKISDDRVDHDELLDILREAIQARNGWKRILARCSNPKRARRAKQPDFS